MPKLWAESIESHRRQVRDAVVDATARLIAEDGLLAVTMSRVADEAGIGRATLYKYFPDLRAILEEWHVRVVHDHLDDLRAALRSTDSPGQRLRALLRTYALARHGSHEAHGLDHIGAVHTSGHVADAERQVSQMIEGAIGDAVRAGEVRGDVAADELASYCLHALGAARGLRSRGSVERLVDVTLSALTPPSE